jgi:hypothetical protein
MQSVAKYLRAQPETIFVKGKPSASDASLRSA